MSKDKDELNLDTVEAIAAEAGQDPDEVQSDFEASFGGENRPEPKENRTEPEAAAASEEAVVDDGAEGAEEGEDTDWEKQYKELQSSIRRLDGRYGTLNSKISQLITLSQRGAEADGGDSPSSQQIKDALKDGERMSRLRADYPDWAGAFDEHLLTMGQHLLERIPDRNDVVNDAAETVTLNIQRPAWRKEINTPEFSEWLNKQDDEIRILADSKYAVDALAMLDKFDQDTGKSGQPDPRRPKQQDRLRSAVSPTSGGARARAQDTEQAEFERAYNSQ